MPKRTTPIAIAAVITIPLIFTLLGAGRDAGLTMGVLLVAIGVVWSAVGWRRPDDQDEPVERRSTPGPPPGPGRDR